MFTLHPGECVFQIQLVLKPGITENSLLPILENIRKKGYKSSTFVFLPKIGFFDRVLTKPVRDCDYLYFMIPITKKLDVYPTKSPNNSELELVEYATKYFAVSFGTSRLAIFNPNNFCNWERVKICSTIVPR